LSSPSAAFCKTGVGKGEGPAAKLCTCSLVSDMMTDCCTVSRLLLSLYTVVVSSRSVVTGQSRLEPPNSDFLKRIDRGRSDTLGLVGYAHHSVPASRGDLIHSFPSGGQSQTLHGSWCFRPWSENEFNSFHASAGSPSATPITLLRLRVTTPKALLDWH
jgi:hypothetical protein